MRKEKKKEEVSSVWKADLISSGSANKQKKAGKIAGERKQRGSSDAAASALGPHLPARISLANKEPPASSAGRGFCAKEPTPLPFGASQQNTFVFGEIATCCKITPSCGKDALSESLSFSVAWLLM